MSKKIKTIKFRRKRVGRTDYSKRLKLLAARAPRLVVRKSLANINAQLISFSPEGDRVLLTASSRELIKLGWDISRSNTPAAYLVGLLLAKKIKDKKIKLERVVLDIGLASSVKGSRLYAVAKGALDGELPLACSEEILPSDERIQGKHIEDYAKTLKDNPDKMKKQFSFDAEKISTTFEKVKKAILGAQ